MNVAGDAIINILERRSPSERCLFEHEMNATSPPPSAGNLFQLWHLLAQIAANILIFILVDRIVKLIVNLIFLNHSRMERLILTDGVADAKLISTIASVPLSPE
jgi:hypothetical protein